jgi:hypothetical protein
MLCAAIVSCLFAGVGVSCASPYVPAHIAACERVGGLLMVAALALLGASLPGVV